MACETNALLGGKTSWDQLTSVSCMYRPRTTCLSLGRVWLPPLSAIPCLSMNFSHAVLNGLGDSRVSNT